MTATTKKVLAVGQLDNRDNEIIKLCPKTAEVALSRSYTKGLRADLLQHPLYDLPDGRVVVRMSLDGMHPSHWRTPRNRQPTVVPFRPTTNQYVTYLTVEEKGEAGWLSSQMTSNERRWCRELVEAGFLLATKLDNATCYTRPANLPKLR